MKGLGDLECAQEVELPVTGVGVGGEAPLSRLHRTERPERSKQKAGRTVKIIYQRTSAV